MKKRGTRKKMIGEVISNKMDKTAVVIVSHLTKHKTYMKYIRSQSKYLAHDPQNLCQIGDRVRMIESKPISKRKRWQILEVIERGIREELESNDADVLENAK
ncbi:MAG: 30S ribosomal protein S17 [Deltaproteobacteria bacterium]|nr:30S ribosomal protein S17 [Deltaproteobacteria bacterium]